MAIALTGLVWPHVLSPVWIFSFFVYYRLPFYSFFLVQNLVATSQTAFVGEHKAMLRFFRPFWDLKDLLQVH